MKRLLLLVLLVGCGSERVVEPKGETPVVETPVDPGEGGEDVLTFAEVQPVIKTFCLPCHGSDNFLKSSTGWFASAAPTRVKNLSMPPPASTQGKNLSAADRQKLLNFK